MPESSWADDIDDHSDVLPSPKEEIKGDNKIVTEYSLNEDGKKVKTVRTYKIEKKMVPKTVARRKALPKFGLSKTDKPGPNPMTTVVTEEIWMQFVANKEESEKEQSEQSALDKLKSSNKGVVKCRICKEDHWTTQCPYKNTLGPLKESLTNVGEPGAPGGAEAGAAAAAGAGSTAGGKYVPPSKRGMEGRVGLGDSMPDKRRDDTAAVRVSNLSENVGDNDLQALFKPFGTIVRTFLAKDKNTGHCKGFAFVNFRDKDEAARAIATLNGFGYDHLILSVEWAKPSADR